MQRPRISLDPFALLLDRMLAHPLAGLVEEMSPDAMIAMRELRADLPAAAAGLERMAVERVTGGIADALGRELRRAIERAQRAGRGGKAKRLAPPKKRRKAIR